MTIGIGAYGLNAGRAVYNALKAAEMVGSGAIGGFVTFAAISEGGVLYRADTQRGGSMTLFTEGETTGVEPPAVVATARFAGLISSGPDRPEPLAQYLTVDPKGGLVTGHRIPLATGMGGEAMNCEALGLLVSGKSAIEAVDQVIDANPEADCGLIAIDIRGGVHLRNTKRAGGRPDLGLALKQDEESGATVGVLHNAITPHPVLAELVAAIALGTMIGAREPTSWVTITAGTPVEMGLENAVYCNAAGTAERITTTDPAIGERSELGVAIYLASAVYLAGALVGHTTFEPITTTKKGRLLSLSGKTSLRMSYR